jgi:predicted dehydrogenase
MQSTFRRAQIHEDLEEALQKSATELTLVLSPVHLHARHTVLALRHYSHVLCEKPMATTEAECEEMLSAARIAGRVLAVGMIRRFFPSFARFKQLLESAAIGKVLSFSYQEGGRFDWDVTTPAAFRRRSEGGAGVLFDIGPHVIDFLSSLFGDPEVRSYADDALGGIGVNVDLELELPTCPGRAQLSWDFPLQNELRVVGSRGVAVLRLDRLDKLAIKTSGKLRRCWRIVAFPRTSTRPPAVR